MTVSSTDQLPIYRDNLDRPMAFGRLYYFEVGTTTPKTIYSDLGLSIPATNPQLLTQEGRTANQIYLASGTYLVQAFYFNGVDPLTDPDDSWDFDHEWTEEGTASANAISGYIPTLDTIADLRAVDVATSSSQMILGYYSAGDMFPRTYRWNPSSLAVDNGGTVIKNNVLVTGAWELVIGNTDVIDVRIFGALPGVASAMNSALTSCASASASSNQPRAVYFPAGVYQVSSGSVTFNYHVIYEAGCQFKNTAVGDFSLVHNWTFDVRHESSFKAVTSTGKAYPTFSNQRGTEYIRPEWYGAVLDGVTDSGSALELMIANITNNFLILLSASLRITTLTNDLTIRNKIKTIRTGRLMMNQTTYQVIFEATGFDNSDSGTGDYLYPVFDTQNMDMYTFSNCKEVRTSWFADYTSYSTLAIDRYGLATYVGVTNFVFDHPISAFTIALTNQSNFRFVYESGEIQTPDYFELDHFNAPLAPVFTNKTIINNGVIHASWYGSAKTAVDVAFRGSGICDLDNQEWSWPSELVASSIVPSLVKIYNGGLAVAYAGEIITLTDSCDKLVFENVNTYCSSYATTLLVVDTGGSVTELIYDKCEFTSLDETTSTLFSKTNSGIFGYVTASNSLIRCAYFTQTLGITANVNITNCNIQADNYLFCSAMRIIGNKIIGCNQYNNWDLASVTPAIISGNNVTSCDLTLHESTVGAEQLIQHIVTGNTFNQADGDLSTVIIKGVNTSSIVRGLSITDNSFTGSLSTLTKCITSSGTFSNSSYRFLITDNSDDFSKNIYAPFTKGSWKAVVDRNAHYWLKQSDNPEMFILNGVSPTVKYCHAYSYINISNIPGYYIGADDTFTTTYLILYFQNIPPATVGNIYLGVSIDLY